MTISKIIIMAEHVKDAEDRLLESLFAAEAIADRGFSDAVVRRIRRKSWARRGCLLSALAIGGAIALQPALAFTALVVNLLQAMPGGVPGVSLDTLPSAAMFAGGGVLFVAAAIGVRFLED